MPIAEGPMLVAKGYAQASDIEPVIGTLLTIGSSMWSVANNRGRLSLFFVKGGKGSDRGATSRLVGFRIGPAILS